MEQKTETAEENNGPLAQLQSPVKRRTFMKYASLTAGVAALAMAGCDDDDDSNMNTDGDAVDFGSNDIGILNYAYALEQLEAGFYTTVVANASFASIFTVAEQAILTDIRDHEIAHREFLKAALGTNAIKDLEVNFSAINFSSRESILNAARTFEDLGVAAYNGAGNLIADVNYLLIAGKIVSVEARHAAAIRDLINPKSTDFAGDAVVDANGFDGAMSPQDVLVAAAPFLKTKVTFKNVPTT